MRLVTFNSTDKKNPIETTIITLGGMAGGISSNVLRWMRQINMNIPETTDLEEYISNLEKFTTESNLNGVLIDLTQRQISAPEDVQSMIAAIIDNEDSQIFVKMTGTKTALLNNLSEFKSLSQSIRSTE